MLLLADEIFLVTILVHASRIQVIASNSLVIVQSSWQHVLALALK